jgi:putative tricarboxylic transport membrane protein
MSKQKVDFNAITGIAVILFGLIYTVMSISLPRAAIGNAMDPIYFPLGLGILLMIIGLVLFVKSDKSNISVAISSMRSKTPKDKEVTRMVTLTCVAAILYGLLFEHLGFIISTFGFMMSVLLITNAKKYIVNATVAIVFSVSIFALFNYALGIPLPGLPFL